MSEVNTTSNRFWREFNADTARTLSSEQRYEIERALDVSTAPSGDKVSDLRLSFWWFFVRITWGPEQRSTDRIKQEQEQHPAMARRNAPVLASMLAGQLVFVYVALAISATLISYLYS